MNFTGQFDERKKQLEKQAVLDSKLMKLPCKDVVYRYLFAQRVHNRNQVYSAENTPFYKIPSVIKDHLSANIKELNTLESILSSINPCWMLSNHLKDNQ